jgi:hypothetical protein
MREGLRFEEETRKSDCGKICEEHEAGADLFT